MDEDEDIKIKTFIKWMGNKSKYLKNILSHFPTDYNTYIEPFVGSGAVFLSVKPKKWIINDLNKDLMNVWLNVRNNPHLIIELFEIFKKDFLNLNKQNKLEFCREITNKIEKLDYDAMRASLFMLMKFCVYMGNLLINNKYYFQGLDLHISIQNRCFFLEENNHRNLIKVSNFLNLGSGKIYNSDYKEILQFSQKGDFVFLDPPYIEDLNYNFNYNKDEELDNEFLLELLTEVKKLDHKGVKWMMTQADTKEIKNIFKNYNIKKFKVFRRNNNSYKNELLIMNY